MKKSGQAGELSIGRNLLLGSVPTKVECQNIGGCMGENLYCENGFDFGALIYTSIFSISSNGFTYFGDDN